ncbi:MAG: tetratricopeptide repeat protein [Candidatus Delongbacteria bacterium]|jgi:tetratricopeptide (TPR) repeat protein|nr:tetratricopeptide repeat protein [Candidatus Delongbacteria bacterium]
MMKKIENKKISVKQKKLNELNLLVRKEPNNWKIFSKRGNYHKKNKNFSKAIKDFEKVIELGHLTAKTINDLGEIFVQIEKYEDAIVQFNKSIKLFPNTIESYRYKGFCLFLLNKYKESIMAFGKVVKHNNTDDQIYHLRATSYLMIKNHKKAIKDYNDAIKLNGKKSQYFSFRAKCYMELKEYEFAVSDYTSALVIDPLNSDFHSNRAKCYVELEKYELAIVDYNNAKKRNRDDASLYIGIATCYFHLGEVELAIEECNNAIKRNIEDALLYFSRGLFHDFINKNKEAIKDLSKAITLNPNDDNYYYLRASTYAKIKKYDKAILDITKAIEINPDQSKYYLKRFSVYSGMNMYDLALLDISKAIELNPKNADYYSIRASYCYVGDEDYSSAIEDFTKCIEIEPLEANNYYFRSVMFLKLSKFQDADLDLKSYFEIEPNEDLYKFLKSSILLEEEKYYEAISLIDELINKYPSSLNLLSIKARILIRMKRYSESKELYEKINRNITPEIVEMNDKELHERMLDDKSKDNDINPKLYALLFNFELDNYYLDYADCLDKLQISSSSAELYLKALEYSKKNKEEIFISFVIHNLLKMGQKKKCDSIFNDYIDRSTSVINTLDKLVNKNKIEYDTLIYLLDKYKIVRKPKYAKIDFLNEHEKFDLILNFISVYYRTGYKEKSQKVTNDMIISLIEKSIKYLDNSADDLKETLIFVCNSIMNKETNIINKFRKHLKSKKSLVNLDNISNFNFNPISYGLAEKEQSESDIISDVLLYLVNEIRHKNKTETKEYLTVYNLLSSYQYYKMKEKEKEIAAAKATEGTVAFISHSIRSSVSNMQNQTRKLLGFIENSDIKDQKVGKAVSMTVLERFKKLQTYENDITDIVDSVRAIQKAEFDMIQVDFKKLVKSIYNEVEMFIKDYQGDDKICIKAKNKKLQLKIKLQDKIQIRGNNTALNIICRDLILNARLYSENGTDLKITLDEDNVDYILKVENTGENINNELNDIYNTNKTWNFENIKIKRHLGSSIIKMLAEKMKWETSYKRESNKNIFKFKIAKN